MNLVSIALCGMGLMWAFGGCAPGGPGPSKKEQVDAMYADYKAKFPQVRGITAAELMAELADEDADLVVVDVRPEAERSVSMLPGALTIDEFDALGDADERSVVTYCTIGARSGNYAQKLMARGIDVRNLEGSILAWTHEGGELVDENGATTRVHVFGERWDLTADGYDGVW